MSRFAFYVVWVGKCPGIYSTWPECEAQTKGLSGSCYKGYYTFDSAYYAIQHSPPHAPPGTSTPWPFAVPANAYGCKSESMKSQEEAERNSSSSGGLVKVVVEDKGRKVTVEGRVKDVCEMVANLKL